MKAGNLEVQGGREKRCPRRGVEEDRQVLVTCWADDEAASAIPTQSVPRFTLEEGVIHWHLQPPCLFSFHFLSLCGSPPSPVPEPHFSGCTVLLLLSCATLLSACCAHQLPLFTATVLLFKKVSSAPRMVALSPICFVGIAKLWLNQRLLTAQSMTVP